MLGDIFHLVPNLRPLMAIENVRLRGFGEIEQDQRFLDLILNLLHLRNVAAGKAFCQRLHHRIRNALRIDFERALIARLHRMLQGAGNAVLVKRDNAAVAFAGLDKLGSFRWHH